MPRLGRRKRNFTELILAALLSIFASIFIVHHLLPLIFPPAIKLCENTKISEDLAARIAYLPLIPVENIKTVEDFEKYLDSVNYVIDSINAIFHVGFKFKKLKIMRTLTLEECLDLARRYNALIEAARSSKYATPTTKRDFCEKAVKLGMVVLILNIKQLRRLNLGADEEISFLNEVRGGLEAVCGPECVSEVDRIISSNLCKYASQSSTLNEIFKKFGIEC